MYTDRSLYHRYLAEKIKIEKCLRNQMVVFIFEQPNGCIMIERRDVFQAIADPTRRMIIQKLAREPLNLATIGEDFGVSRQAIAKHIKVLNECGMIVITQKGRERFCEAKLGQLNDVTDWVTESKKLWNHRFEKLDKFLKETKK
jgi:DNA-binding transcriptional ArsR family regulator